MLLDQANKKGNFKKDKTSDKPIRSIVKTLSWRTVGTLDTICISWLLTGEVETAMTIGAVELVTKMILYFGHERVWNNLNFGRD